MTPVILLKLLKVLKVLKVLQNSKLAKNTQFDFVHFILKFSEEMSMKQTKLIWVFPRQDLEYDWHLNLIDW